MALYDIPVHIKQLISPQQAFHYRIVPIDKNESHTIFKTDSAQIDSLKMELEILLNTSVNLEKVDTNKLNSYLSYNYRKVRSGSLNISKDNFLDQLLNTAKEYGSSDIHIEPNEFICRVRFRLDGKLREQYTIPLSDYPALVNQIKNRAGLDIAQRRLSQDGRISVKNSGSDFDIRVSTMPTIRGEKVVLRILKKDAQKVELKKLGFNERELKLYSEGIKKPNGIVLISGPTGSGKTTTLYGTLRLLNKEETNILTIEDPIEYTLEGINQVQLKEDIGFDFPTALRTFLRQDPDIIMVGEIRDEKTANMAIKAALTGHLVLSTIHTNSAWATVSRLIDMGVPPYLIASTLNMSVAQRLVRKLCNNCKKEQDLGAGLFPEGFDYKNKIQNTWTSTGCNNCHYTGYSGRRAIYEIIPIQSDLETSIKHNELQIDGYLAQNNLKTLKENAIELLNQGITSVDEVYSLLAN
tara:strand:- start:703965 stop:705365 length:1401 start_codon:yes stop_codon:yes gene_type:complete